jgi:hypothetical protein
MPAYISAELSGTNGASGSVLTTAPAGYKPRATVQGGRVKRLRGTFTLSATAVTTSDTLVIGTLPAGSTFAFGVITASATMGATATLAIGTTGATGKYRAAATFTVADTPTMFGVNTAVGAADPALSADEQVFITIGVASLPTAGTLIVDLYYSAPN